MSGKDDALTDARLVEVFEQCMKNTRNTQESIAFKVLQEAAICKNCKHWATDLFPLPKDCNNPLVREMIHIDGGGFDFTTPADFSCNKLELK
jgi:hypothetical protein